MKRALLFFLALLVACAEVDQPEPLPAPQGLSAVASSRQVELSWRESAGALGYNVYRSETPEVGVSSSNKRNAALVAAPSFTDQEVMSGVTYYYVVTAVGPNGESSASDQVRATLDEEVPPVENLEVETGDGEVTLSWEASSAAAGYNVYRSETADVEAAAANRQNPVLYGLTHYTDRSVTSGVTYYYAVAAVDAGGRESALSQVVSATGNRAPLVSAGEDQSASLPSAGVVLSGAAEDDGFPDPPGTLTVLWSEVSGPAEVSFADPGALDTTASFFVPGDYVLRLSADDGALTSSDEVTITVSEAAPVLAHLSWSEAAPVPLAVVEAQGVAFEDKLYVFGGYLSFATWEVTKGSYVYDPEGDTWTRLADMPVNWTHAATAVDGRNFYLAGAYVNIPGLSRDDMPDGTDEVLRYSVDEDAWYDDVPPLPEPRGAGGLVRLGRYLHFFAGHDPERNHYLRNDKADHWALHLDAPHEGWQERAPLPDTRNHVGFAVLAGKIYVLGGQHHHATAATHLSTGFVYDPGIDAWEAIAAMPLALSHHHASTLVLDEQIIVVGGEMAHEVPVDTVLAYDPATDAWRFLTSLPEARTAGVAGFVAGEIVFSGGGNGTFSKDTFRATPIYQEGD